jgi:hypothetical protein
VSSLSIWRGWREATDLPFADVDIALHVGEVLYGNVGAVDRLDFTVIGPAVNEVGSSPELPFEVGRGGHVADSNLGNGILRPETFGKKRLEMHLRIAGPPTETDPWRAKLRKCRAILWRRK